MHKKFNYIVNSLSLLITGLLFLSATTSATDTPSASDSADASVTVGEACSMTGSGMNSHSAEIPNGTYQDEIGTTTIKITCNDSAGFSVYAVGYTGDAIGETNSTKLVGRNTNSLISTSTATSGDNSAWAMKVGTNGSATYAVSLQNGFGSYSAVPASYTKVATRTAGTDVGTGATGSTITTTYASFISRTQPADTYDGKVKYTLVHPNNEAPAQPVACTAGNICYIPGSSTVVGTMANQSASNNATVTLYPSNFSRSGYGFAGWSDAYDYATNPNAHFYGPIEDFTTPSDLTTKGLSLYAVWVKSEGSIQDTNKVASLCGTNGTGGSLTTAPTDGTANLTSVTALTDERDNQTYAIARLADNKCWMIENLRLENTATTGATNTALAQGYNPSFTGLASPEESAKNFSDSTTANSLYSIDGSTENTISGDYQGYRFPRYNNFNTQQRAENTSNTNAYTYSYGNYYTWAAAIADTTHYVHYDGDHTTSICPTSWRLPQGDTTTSGFGKLDVDMGGTGHSQSTRESSNRWRKYPNNFLYSGRIMPWVGNERGRMGFYWSSIAYSSEGSFFLILDRSSVDPGNNSFTKSSGLSIRCTVGS